MAQVYTDPVALERMAAGFCPECGNLESSHGGLGGGGCSLTDNGVAQRIAQYRADHPKVTPEEVWESLRTTPGPVLWVDVGTGDRANSLQVEFDYSGDGWVVTIERKT